jgi:hypothetical protein
MLAKTADIKNDTTLLTKLFVFETPRPTNKHINILRKKILFASSAIYE